MSPDKPLKEMTSAEYDVFMVEHMMAGWVPLKMYVKRFEGETASGVQTRVTRGTWQVGVHYSCPRGGGAWVNLLAVRRWIEAGQPEGQS